MKLIITLLLLFGFSVSQAEPISSLRDWSAEKDVNTALGKSGCIAETTFEDEASDQWTLQVIKLKSNNGDYSTPIIVAFPEKNSASEYYEGEAQSDRVGTPKFSMTLLQPENQAVNLVGSRAVDKNEILRRLRADNKFTVKFINKDDVVKEIAYSLSGSSKTIQAMDFACK